MCIATPVRIKKIQSKSAILEGGRKVDLSLISSIKKGDWLLCHGDLAINKLEDKEAQEILKLVKNCHHNAAGIK